MKLIKYVSAIFLVCVISVTTCHAKKLHDLLLGTWVSVSHQTVTVTNYREDNTFAGTFFTPSMDVKTTFSGKWLIDDDIVFLNYEVSSSPVIQVPLLDRNKIEIVNNDKLFFHTYPQGISLECNRVAFKTKFEVVNNKNQSDNGKPGQKSTKKNIYAKDDGDNQLISGILSNNLSVVKKALESGANINVHETVNGNTPLILAAYHNHLEILKFLLLSGADVNAKCNKKNTALMKAAWNGSAESVKELIKAKADINAGEASGMTPLMIAAFWGHTDIVKSLLEAGCSINDKDAGNNTALSYAKDQGHFDIIQLLVQHKAK